MGHYHQELEKALGEYLGVEYISLFTNGTLPLITALQALDIREGEVINRVICLPMHHALSDEDVKRILECI